MHICIYVHENVPVIFSVTKIWIRNNWFLNTMIKSSFKFKALSRIVRRVLPAIDIDIVSMAPMTSIVCNIWFWSLNL